MDEVAHPRKAVFMVDGLLHFPSCSLDLTIYLCVQALLKCCMSNWASKAAERAIVCNGLARGAPLEPAPEPVEECAGKPLIFVITSGLQPARDLLFVVLGP